MAFWSGVFFLLSRAAWARTRRSRRRALAPAPSLAGGRVSQRHGLPLRSQVRRQVLGESKGALGASSGFERRARRTSCGRGFRSPSRTDRSSSNFTCGCCRRTERRARRDPSSIWSRIPRSTGTTTAPRRCTWRPCPSAMTLSRRSIRGSGAPVVQHLERPCVTPAARKPESCALVCLSIERAASRRGAPGREPARRDDTRQSAEQRRSGRRRVIGFGPSQDSATLPTVRGAARERLAGGRVRANRCRRVRRECSSQRHAERRRARARRT